MKERPSFSQNCCASSVVTDLRCRRSLLLPTSMMTMLESAWSLSSLSHLSTFSNVTARRKREGRVVGAASAPWSARSGRAGPAAPSGAGPPGALRRPGARSGAAAARSRLQLLRLSLPAGGRHRSAQPAAEAGQRSRTGRGRGEPGIAARSGRPGPGRAAGGQFRNCASASAIAASGRRQPPRAGARDRAAAAGRSPCLVMSYTNKAPTAPL
jgi:hypothetical protein